MPGIIEQLSDPDGRVSRLRAFLHDCAGSAACEEGDRVREAARLLGGSGLEGTGPLDRLAMDAMICAGAAVDAVLQILGRDTGFMLSRGQHGACLATVVRSGSDEATAQGSTLALALLCAHLGAVLTGLENGVPVAGGRLARTSVRLH